MHDVLPAVRRGRQRRRVFFETTQGVGVLHLTFFLPEFDVIYDPSFNRQVMHHPFEAIEKCNWFDFDSVPKAVVLKEFWTRLQS